MAVSVGFNPYITTVAAGSFNVSSEGYVQGMLLDNPVELFKIAGGIVAAGEVLPMWGGIAITENIPSLANNVPSNVLGGAIQRATTVANITGFTVYNQAHAMVQTPQSPVPLAYNGNSVNIVRKGANVRLAVACDPACAALETTPINSNVSWDFNNMMLQPYDASTPTYAITSMVWSSTNGGIFTIVMTVPSLVGAVGDVVNISGATNTGTSGAAGVNRNWTVASFTDNEHFTLYAPDPSGLLYGTIAGSPVINSGVGLFPFEVIGFNIGNSMTVAFNPLTGFYPWNRSGSTAIIIV